MNGKREKWDAQQNRNRTSKGQSGGGGVAKLCSLASYSSSSSSFFLFLFMDTNFGIPTRQGSSQSFFGGGGGFSFQKKGSVGHSLPSVTLVSSLVVVLF